jgi:hypothetical protein
MSFITSPGVIVPPLTAGGVAYGTGGQAKVNSAGTAGQVLTSAGAGVPIWAAAVGPATPSAQGILYGKTNNLTPFQTFLGYQAGNVTTGVRNTFLGYQAGLLTTSGTGNTVVGYQALDANTTGTANAAFGSGALGNNTTGTDNVAIGDDALVANTTGMNNVAVGYAALDANTTGQGNTASGVQALTTNNGNFNSAFGNQSLLYSASSEGNSAFGYRAGYNTTGSYNSCFGSLGGYYITSGSGNVSIGDMNSGGSVAPSFQITTQSDRVSIGSTSTTNAYIQVAWTVVSDARDKMNFAPVPHGLDFVKQLNPVQYQFKETRESDVPHGIVRYGFKAQDILALEGNNPVIIDAEDSEKLRYNGESLVPVLVKALQELSAKFDAYVANHP